MTTPPAPSPTDVQAAFAATLVDEWVRAGLTDAVVCPGSRSTPLALALADDGRVRVHVHHDERSGAFLAVGLGLAAGHPAVVLTTSGTAAAELHPGVVEADLAAVPLLVCTADRPPELRDVGAPQAIDQVHLFGRSVRWYGDPGVPEAAGAGRWRPLAARAHAATRGARPGPVHLNLPFREPLVGTPGPLPPARGAGPWVGTLDAGGSRPAVGRLAAGGAHPAVGGPGREREPGAGVPAAVADLVGDLAGRRGLIVAGLAALDGPAVHAAAAALGWPVVAEPRSPAWIAAATLVGHVDALLRSPRAATALRPDVIVRLGAPGSSRVVNEWLAGSGAVEVVAGAPGWSDPSGTAAVVVDGDPGALVAALAGAATRPDGPAMDPGWLARWQAASAAAASAVGAVLGDGPPPGGGPVPARTPSEPAVARAVVRAVPEGGHLVVSSSMPIRDVERYAEARPGTPHREVTVHANRGANGIDGVVSTAVGVALASAAPTVLLIGDVAFLHDSNGLLGAARRGVDLVCVVVDNDGGGIFSFLPQARVVGDERFESLFGTPHGLDLVALAAAYGVDARRLGAADDVEAAVATAAAKGGAHVLVVATDRRANVEVHRRVD
ncbi:MAG TPA: 2-succinyl-5-enolpyruvyl-6-hydroxy-3-cyclohexene-1-carboxylic-acid synthase, partial [Acidimicrobiales bacterium]|nr:2-succinyl-5-enolpyruvyl-6-hydroxy-3-cyclohexene-1-carboxylic-acid synthase [Acidimicrobiales bacterium]